MKSAPNLIHYWLPEKEQQWWHKRLSEDSYFQLETLSAAVEKRHECTEKCCWLKRCLISRQTVMAVTTTVKKTGFWFIQPAMQCIHTWISHACWYNWWWKKQHTFRRTQQKNSYGAVIRTRSDWWYEWLFPLSVPQNRSTLIILSISLSMSLLDQSVRTCSINLIWQMWLMETLQVAAAAGVFFFTDISVEVE